MSHRLHIFIATVSFVWFVTGDLAGMYGEHVAPFVSWLILIAALVVFIAAVWFIDQHYKTHHAPAPGKTKEPAKNPQPAVSAGVETTYFVDKTGKRHRIAVAAQQHR